MLIWIVLNYYLYTKPCSNGSNGGVYSEFLSWITVRSGEGAPMSPLARRPRCAFFTRIHIVYTYTQCSHTRVNQQWPCQQCQLLSIACSGSKGLPTLSTQWSQGLDSTHTYMYTIHTYMLQGPAACLCVCAYYVCIRIRQDHLGYCQYQHTFNTMLLAIQEGSMWH